MPAVSATDDLSIRLGLRTVNNEILPLKILSLLLHLQSIHYTLLELQSLVEGVRSLARPFNPIDIPLQSPFSPHLPGNLHAWGSRDRSPHCARMVMSLKVFATLGHDISFNYSEWDLLSVHHNLRKRLACTQMIPRVKRYLPPLVSRRVVPVEFHPIGVLPGPIPRYVTLQFKILTNRNTTEYLYTETEVRSEASKCKSCEKVNMKRFTEVTLIYDNVATSYRSSLWDKECNCETFDGEDTVEPGHFRKILLRLAQDLDLPLVMSKLTEEGQKALNELKKIQEQVSNVEALQSKWFAGLCQWGRQIDATLENEWILRLLRVFIGDTFDEDGAPNDLAYFRKTDSLMDRACFGNPYFLAAVLGELKWWDRPVQQCEEFTRFGHSVEIFQGFDKITNSEGCRLP